MPRSLLISLLLVLSATVAWGGVREMADTVCVEIPGQARDDGWGGTSVIPGPDRESQTFRWSVRTNTLLPLLNAGVGVTTGPKGRFTVGADVYFPWLGHPSSNRWCIEALAGGVEARWTFRDGTDPLRRGTGPSVGLSAMAGYFDFGRNYRGFQGEFAAAVVDFRWTWPVNRRRWRLGLGVGAGCLRARTRDYVVFSPGGDPYRTGEWTNHLSYWGPLKADLTLTIPLWHDAR